MARLFGVIGNRPDLLPRVFAAEPEVMQVHATSPVGWGLGFYQGGEVLMRRRPVDERNEIDVVRMTEDVRSDVLIGHVRSATVGALRTENTHPFRYRQWLYAQTGTVAGFDSVRDRMLASVPEFLRAGIRGETDAEIVFNVFLSFLHDAGKLSNGTVSAEDIHEALRGSLAVIDQLCAEVAGMPPEINLVLTDGDTVVAVHRRGRMVTRVFNGKDDAEILLGDDQALRRRTPELAQVRFSFVASDFSDDLTLPARFAVIEKRAMVTLTRGQAPKVEPL